MSVIIRLQNLPISANASNIRRFFGGLSIPEGGVHIVGGVEGDAFIAFATDEDARKAMLLDRQSINGTAVRLYLSSKTEMQSIIESARSSALMSGAVIAPTPIPSQKSETMHALDISAPTLPSSFPTYSNGTIGETISGMSHFPYSKSSVQNISSSRPVDSMSRSKSEVYPGNSFDCRLIGNSKPPERDSAFYERQVSIQPERRDNHQELPSFDCRQPVEQPYDSYYDEYDYNRRPPQVSHEAFASRGDKNLQSSPRDRFVDYGSSRPLVDNDPSDYRRYPPHVSANRSDRFSSEISNRSHQQGYRMHPTKPPVNQDVLPSNPKMQFERDFSVRPPWLSNDLPENGQKRAFQSQTNDFEEHSVRKRKPPVGRPLDDKHFGETEYVVRVALPLPDVGVKTVFEIFHGVHIVRKWGIRLEEDKLQRFTGNVMIMLTGSDSYDRALSFNGRSCRNGNISVFPSTRTEFYHSTDSNFTAKCPPEIAKNIPPPNQCFPPHYSDGCLELAELPTDTSTDDVVQFLGAPGLTPGSVVLCRFLDDDKALPKSSNPLRALVTLPSANDLKILLSAKPRPFRANSDLPPVRLTAVSKTQLITYSKQHPRIHSQNHFTNNHDSSKIKNVLPTCAYLSGLSYPMKEPEVIRLFPFILIPGDAIRMGPNGTTAYIDFISENNCRRAVSNISKDNSVAKQAHPMVRIEAISRGEMESRLGDSLNAENGSDRISKSREGRNQWDSRSRPPPSNHPPSQFNERLPPERANFDDGYYDRALPPQAFEDFPSDPFVDHGRRPRARINNPHSIAPLPPMPPVDQGSQRLGMSDRMRHTNHDFVTVFIGNIPAMVTVDQLSGILREYYFIPGSIRMRRNTQGQPVGEALVDFNSSYEADRALRGLNGYRISGRQLILRFDHRS